MTTNDPPYTHSASAVMPKALYRRLVPESPPLDPSFFSEDAWAGRLANSLGISKEEALQQIHALRAMAKEQKETP